ncbi:MAG TPA: exodeoxyribonuclease VII small subunit [Chthoniobacterales bacterium]|jgi:exodeoxyribonuclease VII small subunit|nr:exodeoxyribonuclease VII small subunit [Chthoniobacterales bacterium]
MPTDEPDRGDPSFEEAMERLEKIVEEMESSKLPLEELIVRYEEGIRLVGVCNRRLAAAENRIETLNRSGNGKILAMAPEAQAAPKDIHKIKNDETRLF